MADYITAIRTVDGDKKIDYNALANKPDLSGVKELSDSAKQLRLDVDEVYSWCVDIILPALNECYTKSYIDAIKTDVQKLELDVAANNIEIEKKATTETYTVSVPTSWSPKKYTNTNGETKDAGYGQTITVDGITSADNPIVDIVLSTDPDKNELYKEAWALIDRIVTSDNLITLYANSAAPTTAFTIQLKVVR